VVKVVLAAVHSVGLGASATADQIGYAVVVESLVVVDVTGDDDDRGMQCGADLGDEIA
jgi:hypothetical protein